MKATIELGGSPRTFHFGIGFLSNALETLGITYEELGVKLSENPFKLIPVLMYEAYAFNKWVEDKENDVSQDDVKRWLVEFTDINDKPILEFLDAFLASRSKHVTQPEEKTPAKGRKGKK